jgi:hypothetical protein
MEPLAQTDPRRFRKPHADCVYRFINVALLDEVQRPDPWPSCFTAGPTIPMVSRRVAEGSVATAIDGNLRFDGNEGIGAALHRCPAAAFRRPLCNGPTSQPKSFAEKTLPTLEHHLMMGAEAAGQNPQALNRIGVAHAYPSLADRCPYPAHPAHFLARSLTGTMHHGHRT